MIFRITAAPTTLLPSALWLEVPYRLPKHIATLSHVALISCSILPFPFPHCYGLPQTPQPLHPCLLKISPRFDSYHAVPNPYEADIDGRRVLGHSGLPVRDIAKQTVRPSTAA